MCVCVKCVCVYMCVCVCVYVCACVCMSVCPDALVCVSLTLAAKRRRRVTAIIWSIRGVVNQLMNICGPSACAAPLWICSVTSLDPRLPFLHRKDAWDRGYRVTGQATVKERRVTGKSKPAVKKVHSSLCL